MSIFFLSGFSSFTADGAGFLIPFLIKRGTNKVFVQELDDAYNIAKFQPFISEHYEPVFYSTNPIPKELGQPGILAFRLESGEIVFGEIDEVRDRLRSHIGLSSITPSTAFFDLEASMLVGDLVRIHDAIDATAQLFGNATNRATWRSLEFTAADQVIHAQAMQTTSSGRGPEHPDSAAHLDALLADRQDPEWFRKFRRLWNNSESRPELLEIACQWIENEPIESDRFPEVVLLVLKSFHNNQILRDAAIRWLRIGDYKIVYWGFIWLELNIRLANKASPFMEKEGIQFLEDTLDLADRRSVEIWARIWTRIRNRRKLSEQLVRLAERALPKFGWNPKFVQLVLANLGSEPFAVEAVINWLRTASEPTIAWADTYVRVSKGNPRDRRLLTIGLDWLRTNQNLNRWKAVWDAVRSAYPDSSNLMDIARSWLERAYPDINVWPEVMSEVIESGIASEIEIEIAGRWLASHANRKETKAYVRLSNLVEGAKRNHSLPPEVAILRMRSRLENEIEGFARRNGLRLYENQPTSSTLEMLRNRELLSSNLLATIGDLISFANSAVHSKNQSTLGSNDVIRFGDRLDRLIEKLWESRQKN